MTAAHPSPYVFSIDWDDDSYGNALAAIPAADLQSWDIDAGGIDEELAPTPTDGAINLFNADGRYQNVGTFTDAQLRSVHRWRVTASGVVQACGRCYPAAGLPLLQTIEPSLWLLEGETTPSLLSRRHWQIDAGTLDTVAAAITTQSGVTVSTTRGGVSLAEADITGIDWSGTLTGLLGRLARAIGGLAVQRHDGVILLVESANALNQPASGTVNAATALVDATATRVGQRSDLVRTEVVVPVPIASGRHDFRWSVPADIARYGRRTVVLEYWSTVLDLFHAGSIWATPWTEIHLALIDAARDTSPAETARLASQVTFVRPGNIISVVLPNGTGGTTTYKTLVVSVRLVGGTRTPERVARLIVLHSVNDDAVVPPDPEAGAPPRPRLTVDGMTVQVAWFNRLGNADVVRRAAHFPPGDATAADGVSVAADVASPQFDTPGLGIWSYRLRIPATDGVWGPWGSIELTDKPAPLTLTVSGATVTISWPSTLTPVDIRRRGATSTTFEPVIVATAEAGTLAGTHRTHTDTPTAGTDWYYSIRHPAGSGQWSDWAGPVITEAAAGGFWRGALTAAPADITGYSLVPAAPAVVQTYVNPNPAQSLKRVVGFDSSVNIHGLPTNGVLVFVLGGVPYVGVVTAGGLLGGGAQFLLWRDEILANFDVSVIAQDGSSLFSAAAGTATASAASYSGATFVMFAVTGSASDYATIAAVQFS